jgi:adenylate cyclase class 2
MAYEIEIETKILDIEAGETERSLVKLGARLIKETTLRVDWYRPKGIGEGEDPWFLRIRSDDEGKCRVTWKAKSDILGVARKHKEIDFAIAEPEKMADLFKELGLEFYAHQDKKRKSFALNDWIFEIDQYPQMPPFLEVEGVSEGEVKKAIALLGLEHNRTWARGERILIQEIYGLDWYDMRF